MKVTYLQTLSIMCVVLENEENITQPSVFLEFFLFQSLVFLFTFTLAHLGLACKRVGDKETNHKPSKEFDPLKIIFIFHSMGEWFEDAGLARWQQV